AGGRGGAGGGMEAGTGRHALGGAVRSSRGSLAEPDAQGRGTCARRGQASISSFAVVVLRRLPSRGLQERGGLLVEAGRIFQADRRFLEECAIDGARGEIGSRQTGMALVGRIQVQLR